MIRRGLRSSFRIKAFSTQMFSGAATRGLLHCGDIAYIPSIYLDIAVAVARACTFCAGTTVPEPGSPASTIA